MKNLWNYSMYCAIKEWDGEINKVWAMKSKSTNYVDLTYADGVTYTVTEKYFKSMLIDNLN